LLGRFLGEYSVPQPGSPGGLRDGSTATAAERATVAAHHEPGAGGCEDRVDWIAAGARTVSDRGGYAGAGRREPQGRAKPVQVRGVDGGTGHPGAEGPGARSGQRSTGHGQLHPRADRVRHGDGTHPGGQPHLDGGSAGGAGAERIDHTDNAAGAAVAGGGEMRGRSRGGIRLLPCASERSSDVRAEFGAGVCAALVGHASACQASVARPVRAALGWTRRSLIPLLAATFLVTACEAQNLPFTVQKPSGVALLRPYRAQTVPAVRLNNSDRLHTLLRAGKLYLTVQDAIALAIENNLGLETDRYGPLLAQSALERALAGGPIRGVPSASAQVSSVNAGVGVAGSTARAGLGGGGGGGSGGGSGGNAAIQQVGAITPNLDPVLQSSTTQSHLTQPQANRVLSQTNELIESARTTNTTLQMGLLTGGVVQYRNYEQSFKENAPSDSINPAVGPHMDLAFQHSLLRGFGVKLNDRGIRIAKLNTGGSLEQFRSQLLDLVANVLNSYW